MKIGEISRRTGMSIDTLRYYERIGLLPPIDREASGHRDYESSILDWIEFIRRLKTTGMPIREIREYADLRLEGPATEPDRRALLVRHRERVRRSLAELETCLSVIDTKIASYGDQT